MAADVNLVLTEKLQTASKEELSKVFDEEIESFSKYMESLNDFKAAQALIPMERALVKTYLIYKHKQQEKA